MSTISINASVSKTKLRRNFRATNWVEFGEALKEKMEKLEEPREFRMGERAAFERVRMALERGVMETIEEKVPITQSAPHTKRWWTHELSQMKAGMQKLARKSA